MVLAEQCENSLFEPLLEVRNLTKNFGGLTAVNKINFELFKTDILGLIGPNGAGKTTVLNLITGTHNSDKGEIVFQKNDISRLKPYQIARKGITKTFQLVRLLPSMTVLENVMVGLMFCGSQKKKSAIMDEAESHLRFVEYQGDPYQRVESLTYIDKKKVELARALSLQPEILLLDEFLAGLNPTELEVGIDIVKKVKKSGIAIILVEHVIKAVVALCDRIVVMNAGSKITEGSPETVLNNDAVIKAYLGDAYAKS